MNDYVLEVLVKERMAQARRYAAERALLRASRPRRPPLRIWLGLALVRVGHRVLGEALEGGRDAG
ncbi:MAG: hypothetical protein L0214_09335 [candidate division NC10 bacterium]|nr:hypothetical protein [candidate division NC10 bacterium]